ncbi:MAG TPA: histone deacetylase [Aggregatilineales bacterium]|nr:histone deacetylase [Aggregatilineales bacterium]
MKCFYCDDFVLPLPEGHRFPMRKYALLRERLLTERVIASDAMHVPPAATDEQILRCHHADYLTRVVSGTLTDKEIRRIGFPWSPQMVERCRRSAGATIAACRAALNGDGLAANLAGGTHHACRDHGEGFCVFNDAAIAARAMQAEGLARRVVIIDCDVHQGNGTADILNGDSSVFTFSIHGEKNFPFRKVAGTLDIGLPDGVTDREYLETVEEGTRRALHTADADLAIYISGADPYTGDRLGKLAITKDGLQARDQLVLDLCAGAGLPVAIAMGGGYADNVHDIVDIHFNTVRLAASRVKV